MKIFLLNIKQVIALLLLTFIVLLGIIVFINRPEKTSDAFFAVTPTPIVIIDAGHGGHDGGAVSRSGFAEAPINLEISIKLRDVLGFLGVSAIMTRENAESLGYIEGETLRKNKTADLNARLEIADNNPSCDFLSIHLNKYEQEKYYGAQVFYSPNNDNSSILANALQEKMRMTLDEANTRRAKLSPSSVYLMDKIKNPAVTIECGFLSNAREAELLGTNTYQTKVSIAICAGYIEYIEMSDA